MTYTVSRGTLNSTIPYHASDTLASLDVWPSLKPTFIKLTPITLPAIVLLVRDSLVRLGGSLCLGEAVFQISVLSSSCWHTAISNCCNDSRHCHAKVVIRIGLDV